MLVVAWFTMGKYKLKHITHKEACDVEEYFKSISTFISSVVEHFPHAGGSDEENDTTFEIKNKALPDRLCPARKSGKQVAQTVEELEEKLSALKGKPSLGYKDKLIKKGLKNRIKKKEKKEIRRVKKLENKSKPVNGIGVKDEKPSVKPVYNSEGNMVFSKFDFSEFGGKTGKVGIKDPKVALKKVKEQEQRLQKLEEEGLKDKVLEIKEKKAWKTALLKSQGVKIKDDPELLKATIKKVKKRKEKSKAKWKASQKKIAKEKEDRQEKRTANLQARSKEKKLKKLKTQAKRGRVIAGF